MLTTTWTHDIEKLIERIRSCDGKNSDAIVTA